MNLKSKYVTLLSYVVFSLVSLLPMSFGSKLNSVLSDSNFYHITWPGPFTIHPNTEERQTIVMSTKNKETYVCTIPSMKEQYKPQENLAHYKNPLELIKELIGTCSYRIETYWTYEICHGKALRQYHEQMDAGKTIQLQEYFLGQYKSTFEEDLKNNHFDTRSEYLKRTVFINGVSWPYVSVNFTEGTICDLTGKHREARLFYICQVDGRGEVLELKETSSCSYDVIIMTKLLCSHPAFKPEVNLSNNIECFAVGSTSRRPIDLNLLDLDAKAFQSGATLPKAQPEPPKPKAEDKETRPALDDIMKGEYCFTGGSGWWHHELCLSRYAQQFHRDRKTGAKSTVVLGNWDREKHLQWIKLHPELKYKTGDNTLNLLYTLGDFCELTNNYRQVIVKLVCGRPVGKKPFETHVEESEHCSYKLYLESEMICPIFDHLDEDGIPMNE